MEAAAVIAGKLLISAWVLARGFHALSDDDFARVSIAQGFARAPSLDPSGTSWLPLPFYVTGAAHALFGPSFAVARGVAIALGALSVLAVWQAARWCGFTPRARLLAACGAAALPYSQWLGVATVPELPTATLGVLAAASLTRTELRARLLGAAAIAAATLCRYEAWPLAASFAAISLYDAARARRAALLAPALLAITGAVLWLAHGALHHADATYFVKRVADYRRALGGTQIPFTERLFALPLALLRCEPELAALTLLGLASLGRNSWRVLSRLGRPLWLALALLAFLVVGELRDGAPTHHGERALLFAWLVLALVGAAAWDARLPRPRSAPWVASALAATLGAAFVLRPWYARTDGFVDRREELALGAELARRLPADSRLAIETGDFGWFALEVGYGRDAVALDEHDPRKPSGANLLADPALLDRRLRALRADALVVPRSVATQLGLGPPLAESQRYVAWSLRR